MTQIEEVASVNGTMAYDEYEKSSSGQYVLVKKSCSLNARMNGKVEERRASGSYSEACAKEDDSGCGAHEGYLTEMRYKPESNPCYVIIWKAPFLCNPLCASF